MIPVPVPAPTLRLYAVDQAAGLIGGAVFVEGQWECLLLVEGLPHQVARLTRIANRQRAEAYIRGGVHGAWVAEVLA